MSRNHFGTDGVRGTVGASPMTADFVLRLGYAAGKVLSGQGEHPSVLKGMKVVVDCAHGAAYNVAPHVFHELGADVVPIGVKPDGLNINEASGATSPESLLSEVKNQAADLGVALDGDGDRVLIVDDAG